MSDIIEQVLRTNIYIQPFYFLLTITTNILNICVLRSRALRASPCTHYFLAYAVFSLSYTCFLCPVQFLRGFSISWTNGNLGCKMQFYILFVIPFAANLMLILASFDRYCSSSLPHRLHSRSTIRTARLNIVVGTVVIAIYMLPMLVIYEWNETRLKCLPEANIPINIYVFSQVYLFHILSPVLLFIFGLLTINSIHQQSHRAIPSTAAIRGRRTEGQLARMLILQVVVHIILVLPFGVTYTVNFFIPSTQTTTVIAIRQALVTWNQCDYFVSFFLYILSGSVYRRELIRICRSLIRHNIPVQSLSPNQRYTYRDLSLIDATRQTNTEIMYGSPV